MSIICQLRGPGAGGVVSTSSPMPNMLRRPMRAGRTERAVRRNRVRTPPPRGAIGTVFGPPNHVGERRMAWIMGIGSPSSGGCPSA